MNEAFKRRLVGLLTLAALALLLSWLLPRPGLRRLEGTEDRVAAMDLTRPGSPAEELLPEPEPPAREEGAAARPAPGGESSTLFPLPTDPRASALGDAPGSDAALSDAGAENAPGRTVAAKLAAERVAAEKVAAESAAAEKAAVASTKAAATTTVPSPATTPPKPAAAPPSNPALATSTNPAAPTAVPSPAVTPPKPAVAPASNAVVASSTNPTASPSPTTPTPPKPAAPAPAPVAASPAKPASAAMTWFAQCGVYSQIENAQSLRDDLVKRGLTCFMSPLDSAKGTMYRVRCGPFKSRGDAEIVVSRIRDRVPAIVVDGAH